MMISDLEYTCLLGLPLIPVHTIMSDGSCSCEEDSCRSKGKHPATRNGVHDGATLSPHELSGYNVGICAGDGIIVIDVDPRNGGLETLAALEKKHGKMPLTLTCKTGGQGWHYYYRVSREVRKKPNAFGKGIDLQSTGSYCVAPPSIHMSGARYIWDKRVEISSAPEWIFDYLEHSIAPINTVSEGNYSIYSESDWRSMLSKIHLAPGDYQPWMQVCFGLHALGEKWCFEAFHEWSESQVGYVSREDCLKHWNSCKHKKQGNAISPASVIAMAYANGWKWEPEISVSFDPIVDEGVVNFPRNKFGKICEWYHNTSAYNHPSFAVISALFSAVPFIQRNYKPCLVDNMALSALMVAPSGNGKGFFLNAPFKLIRRHNSKVCVDMTSSALMTRQLVSEYNSRVLFKDEAISQLLRWSKNDFGAEQFETFMSMTSGAYIQGQSFRGAKRVPSLEDYSYSFCGNGTIKMYIQLLNSKNFKESGSLSRFIVAISEDRNKLDKMYPSLDVCLPDEYCDFIHYIKDHESIDSAAYTISVSDSTNNATPSAKVIPFKEIQVGSGVEKEVIEFRKISLNLARKYDDDFGTEEFFTRAGENSLRMANVISVVNNHVNPVVDVDTLKWCQEFTISLIKTQAKLFRENIETSKFDTVKNRVLRSILRGKITRREISRHTRVTGKQLDECLQSLQDEGLITTDSQGWSPT